MTVCVGVTVGVTVGVGVAVSVGVTVGVGVTVSVGVTVGVVVGVGVGVGVTVSVGVTEGVGVGVTLTEVGVGEISTSMDGTEGVDMRNSNGNRVSIGTTVGCGVVRRIRGVVFTFRAPYFVTSGLTIAFPSTMRMTSSPCVSSTS